MAVGAAVQLEHFCRSAVNTCSVLDSWVLVGQLTQAYPTERYEYPSWNAKLQVQDNLTAAEVSQDIDQTSK